MLAVAFFASALTLTSSALSLTCKTIPDEVPCTEVPKCGTGYGLVTVNQLSTGLGASVASSEISLCYDNARLYLNHTASKQQYMTSNSYTQCNDDIYYADVAEFFIAPYMEAQPHCYSELDISPFNVMFSSGIYNKNLNQTGIVNSNFGCDTDFPDITHEVVPWSKSSQQWVSKMSFSWALLNSPYNCPLPNYGGHSTPNPQYRANFFRINELVDNTTKCSSSGGTCEYMAWNPTLANPPAFHIPSKFGFLIMV